MSDSDNDDEFHEDESDQEIDEEEDVDSDEEYIENHITNNQLVEIGGETYDRRTVTEIEVKKGVTEIPDYTFNSAILCSKIKLPTSLKSIGMHAMFYCKSLKSVVLNNGLITIESGAFNSSSLHSIVIPNTVTTVGTRAFGFCNFLKSVTLLDSISTIEEGVFYKCSALETIKLHSSITSIQMNALVNCSALRSIIIPIGATVHSTAFKFCTKLEAKSSSYNMTVVEYYRDYYHERVKRLVVVLNCLKFINAERMRRADEQVEMMEEAKRRKLNSSEGSSSVVVVGGGGFGVVVVGRILIINNIKRENARQREEKDNITVTEIEVKKGVTEIPNYTFECAILLSKIKLPTSLKSIGNGAMNFCRSLKSIVLNNGLITIGTHAFQSSSLESIVIPNTVTTLGSIAFAWCGFLKSVTLSDSISTIEE